MINILKEKDLSNCSRLKENKENEMQHIQWNFLLPLRQIVLEQLAKSEKVLQIIFVAMLIT